jgi:hypothetical protein
MVDTGERGVRLSIVCPRCEWTAPPHDTRLVACESCGLSFDATVVREPKVRSAPPPPVGTRGTFRAPSMGTHAAPFPITGAGTCELEGDHLTVTGFRTRGAWLRFLVILGGFSLAIVVAIGLASIDLDDHLVVVSGFLVFLLFVLTPLPASRIAARFHIPYENIRRVMFTSSEVLIEVRDFAPRGEIHFACRAPDELAAQISARRSTSPASSP